MSLGPSPRYDWVSDEPSHSPRPQWLVQWQAWGPCWPNEMKSCDLSWRDWETDVLSVWGSYGCPDNGMLLRKAKRRGIPVAWFDPLNPTVLGFYLIQYISSFCLNQFWVSVTYNPKNSNKKKISNWPSTSGDLLIFESTIQFNCIISLSRSFFFVLVSWPSSISLPVVQEHYKLTVYFISCGLS